MTINSGVQSSYNHCMLFSCINEPLTSPHKIPSPGFTLFKVIINEIEIYMHSSKQRGSETVVRNNGERIIE